MQRSKIEWTGYSWNPIRGICPVDCKTPDGKSYCYARKIYGRFHLNKKPRISFDEIVAPRKLKYPAKIFVCSTHELFHSSIPNTVRNKIFEVIEECPQHVFQILTKFPQNIDRPMPDNVWLGVTITGNEVFDRYQGLLDADAKIKFVSFEPIFRPIYLPLRINWAIIGRLTGHGHKYDPSLSLLEIMVNTYKVNHVPVFLKNNLQKIWGEPLIQEYPENRKD